MTHAADGDGVYTATSGHGPADDAVHGLAVQEGEDLPAGAILATGKRDAPAAGTVLRRVDDVRKCE